MRRLVASLVGALGLVLIPAPAEANPPAEGIWGVPVIKVHSAVAKDWRATKAIRTWRQGLPAGMTIKGVSAPCLGCITIREVADIPGYEQASGVADWRFSWDGAKFTMQHCDIQVKSSVTGLYRRSVLAHEIGHCLGLPHTEPGSDSIMRTDLANVGPVGPTATDLAWLREEYTPKEIVG